MAGNYNEPQRRREEERMTTTTATAATAAYLDGGPSPNAALASSSSSVWPTLVQSVQQYPNKTALICMHQQRNHLETLVGPSIPQSPIQDEEIVKNDNLSWTYSQLHLGSTRLSSYLFSKISQSSANSNPLKDDTSNAAESSNAILMTFIPNCAEWCLFSWAASQLSLTFVPLDLRILTEPARRHELRYFLRTLRPECVVVLDEAGMRLVDEEIKCMKNERKSDSSNISSSSSSTVKSAASLVLGICLNTSKTTTFQPPSEKWISMSAIAEQQQQKEPWHFSNSNNRIINKEQIATIIYTSGTSSGTPKGCPHTPTTLLNSSSNNSSFWGLNKTTRSILHYSNFRIICTILTLSHLQKGATVIMPASPLSFNAAATLDAIVTHAATDMLLMPAMMFSISELQNHHAQNLTSLKHVSLAGDVITTALLKKTRLLFPSATIFNQHGMTEGSGILGWPADMNFSTDHHEPTPLYQDIASVGTALPGSKVRIVSEKNNSPSDSKFTTFERGQIGELHLGGLSVIQKYLGDVKPELFYHENDDKDKTAWLITGDRAMIDKDGWVYILGRSKDIIKRGGVPIAPAGLQACLNEYTNSQTFVIGMPHEKLGQEPFAIVAALGPEVDGASMEKHIIEKFGREYALGGVLTLEQLGMTGWPINATGKIMGIELQAAAAEYLQRAARSLSD